MAVGVTAVPIPITDMGSNLWLLHQLMYADQSGLIDTQLPATQYSVDSKAMRKVEVGQDIIVAAETAAIGLGVRIIVGGRMLIKNN